MEERGHSANRCPETGETNGGVKKSLFPRAGVNNQKLAQEQVMGISMVLIFKLKDRNGQIVSENIIPLYIVKKTTLTI